LILESRKRIAGIMSGTSCDGLDIAVCEFYRIANQMEFKLLYLQTFPFPSGIYHDLRHAHQTSALDYFKIQHRFTSFVAESVNHLPENVKPVVISCHGHTVFHQPEIGLTCQILNGAQLSVLTQCDVVCDFRTSDVAASGQGAPLVPIGERDLFHEFDGFINLGGIANITVRQGDEMLAWDLTVCNMALNDMANKLQMAYDEDGKVAATGKIHDQLLHSLNNLPYVTANPPKSTGREWYQQEILPLLNSAIHPADILATVCEHIALVTAKVIHQHNINNLMITGGGTHNRYLISRIRHHCSANIHIPDTDIINGKEAIIFGYLGYLRLLGLPNALGSVTGAKKDTIGGAVYLKPS
jgi:anhydro-N-acetylmuramic acid kinase